MLLNNDNDAGGQEGSDDLFAKWEVSMDTEWNKKASEKSENDSDIKWNSSMMMLELRALSVFVCALVVADACGDAGWSSRGGGRRSRGGSDEKLSHDDVYACAGWRIVVGSWSCCAVTSRPMVRLSDSERRLPLCRCGRAAVYSCYLSGFSSFWPETSGFVLVSEEGRLAPHVRAASLLPLWQAPGRHVTGLGGAC